MLGVIVGLVVVAAVVALGVVAPQPQLPAWLMGRPAADWRMLPALAASVSATVLVAALLGISGAAVGGPLVVLLVSLVVLVGLASLWAWLRLRTVS